MKITRKMNAATLLLTIGFFVSSSSAASAQPYATGAAGIALNSVDCSETTFPNCDKNDLAFKVIGGYRVASWIAGEVVYLDFGEGRKSNRFAEDTMHPSGFGGGLALRAKSASWTMTARVGAARAAVKRFAMLGQQTTFDSTFADVAPYAGAEIDYRLSNYVALAFGVDAMRSKWLRSDGQGWTWIASSVTAGVTIGR